MSRALPEADWKVLRRLHPLVLERFCERVLGEIDGIGRDNARSFHQRYLDVYQIVERCNREIERMFDDPRRSNAITRLAQMHSNGLLTEDEFSQLSEETRAAIGFLVSRIS
jgi:hypothetical protein